MSTFTGISRRSLWHGRRLPTTDALIEHERKFRQPPVAIPSVTATATAYLVPRSPGSATATRAAYLRPRLGRSAVLCADCRARPLDASTKATADFAAIAATITSDVLRRSVRSRAEVTRDQSRRAFADRETCDWCVRTTDSVRSNGDGEGDGETTWNGRAAKGDAACPSWGWLWFRGRLRFCEEQCGAATVGSAQWSLDCACA